MNLASRAGRWSAAHWKTATIGWLVLVVTAVAAGSMLGSVTQSPAEQTSGGAAKAERILATAGFHTPAGEAVIVRSATMMTGAPAFQGVVRDVRAKLAVMPQVRNLHAGGVSRTVMQSCCSSTSPGRRRPQRIASSRCSTGLRRSPRLTRASRSPRWATRVSTRR